MTKKTDQSAKAPNSGTDTTQPEVLLDLIYPDPASTIAFQPAQISQMKDSAVVFLDTNVLLVPYHTGKNSLADIVRIYSQLIARDRLIVPARAMQEFLKNSPDRLKDVFQKLSRQRNIGVAIESYPLLDNVPEYGEFLTARTDLVAQIKVYQQKLGKLVDVIQGWHHDDPVRKAYGSVFSANQIIPLEGTDHATLMDELDRRYELKIPPGYKDGAKPDNGIGDLLIWKTILQVAKARQCDAIFVCGEEKADWWHRSEGQPLVVRQELIDEYRRESHGKTFRLIGMGDFLELFGAQHSVVEEVKEEQKTLKPVTTSGLAIDWQRFAYIAEQAVLNWLVSQDVGLVRSRRDGELTDFEVETADGRIFVEVKVGRPEHSSRRIREVFRMAAAYREKEQKLVDFLLVLVAVSEADAIAIALPTATVMNGYPSWFVIKIGYLNLLSNFIEVPVE